MYRRHSIAGLLDFICFGKPVGLNHRSKLLKGHWEELGRKGGIRSKKGSDLDIMQIEVVRFSEVNILISYCISIRIELLEISV